MGGPKVPRRIPYYRASPNEVTSRSIVDPLRRKDFATVWLSLHSTSLCNSGYPRGLDRLVNAQHYPGFWVVGVGTAVATGAARVMHAKFGSLTGT
jgi:hypothetical protein